MAINTDPKAAVYYIACGCTAYFAMRIAVYYFIGKGDPNRLKQHRRQLLGISPFAFLMVWFIPLDGPYVVRMFFLGFLAYLLGSAWLSMLIAERMLTRNK